MDVVYGIKIANMDDPYVSSAEDSLDGIAAAGVPGSFVVDLVPILKHMPGWIPGANFQRYATHVRAVNGDMIYKPWNAVKNNNVDHFYPMGDSLLTESLASGKSRTFCITEYSRNTF